MSSQKIRYNFFRQFYSIGFQLIVLCVLSIYGYREVLDDALLNYRRFCSAIHVSEPML